MTRPTRFAIPWPQGTGIPGGDPSLPPGQEPLDCCDDEAEIPDRAEGSTPFIGVPVSALFAEIIADNPDWYYVLNEASGTFVDSSGHLVSATNTGSFTYGVTGPLPGETAITADSTDSMELGYVAGPYSAESIEGWFKWTGSAAVLIEQNRGGPAQNGRCLQLGIGSTGGFGAGDGQITAYFNATSFWLGIHTTGTYNDGNWHHVVATWSGGGAIATGQLKIYVDGTLATTTADGGNTGSASAPVTGALNMSLFNDSGGGPGGSHGAVSASNMAFYGSALSGTRVLAHFDAAGAATDWRGAGPAITDGDDDTCQEVIGEGVLRLWLGYAFAIARVRLLIECETAGPKTYTLWGATQADFSDAVVVDILDFMATGSFTADDISDSFTPSAYEFWQLTGDDETRNVCSFELYEGSEGGGVTVHGDLTGLGDDDHPQYILHTEGDAAYLKVVDGGGDTVEVHGSAGSTETIDPADGNVHTLTLTADCTITLTGPDVGPACAIEVYATQDGTGGWDITWPGSVVWPGGVPPTPDTTLATLTRYLLETFDGGTIWYGVMVGGGGSSLDPATTVEDETSFGITPAVGTDTEYARQDHTHGTPDADAVRDVGRWELAVVTGSPPDSLYADGDWLYIWVEGA